MDPRRHEVARVLFQLAWADGEIQDSEVHAISLLLERIGIPLAERVATMDRGLSEPGAEAPPCENTLQDRELRRHVLGMLIELAFADQTTHPDEIRMLGDLAVRWGFSAEELEELRVRRA